MNKFSLIVICSVWSFFNIYSAQAQSVNSGNKVTQNEIDAKNILIEYSTKHKGSGLEGNLMLENIQIKGLSKIPEHVGLVRAALASNITDGEKARLARILGSLHTYDNRTGLNVQIENDLRANIYSGKKESANAALLAYTRSGYYKDSTTILAYAKDNNLIDDNGYYGELSHLLNSAPPTDQLDIASKIKTGKNRYSVEILAANLPIVLSQKNLYPETKSAIYATLLLNEPAMPIAIGEFGYTAAIRYSNWLHAVALLRSDIFGEKYETAVFSILDQKTIDQRKVMSFLISDEGKALMQKINNKSVFEPYLQKISFYSKQLPGNAIMRDIITEISTSVKSLKG